MLLPTAVLFFAFLSCLWFVSFLFGFFRPNHGKSSLPLPPGPMGLPIVGHLLKLGDLPHCALHRMAKKYGPIMYIRLGLVPTIVVSSPEYAELFLKTHDANFSNRPTLEAAKYMAYGRKGLIFLPYGPYWRNMRRLCTLELLSNTKVQMFTPMRKQEVIDFIEAIKLRPESGSLVDITEKVGSVVENMTYKMLFGFKVDKCGLKPTIDEVVSLAGVFSIADFIPWLGPLDIQGYRRRMKRVAIVMDTFFETLIDEHEKDTSSLPGEHRDFLDIMLSLMHSSNTQGERINRDNIKAILVDLLGAAMDTTATAIEWTVAELLKNPRVMALVQEELEKVVGLDRMVEEEDLVKMEYLKMVVKESMRLHPVVPLTPHEAIEDKSINGYFIPKGSLIMINIWAIGRDPIVWSRNAHDFYPERFVDSSIDLRGRDFQLIPFGSGRRKCVGMQLGLTAVEYVVAQLVHCFNLSLPHGMLPGDLDMEEKYGLTLPRANHLVLIPTYRLLK
ncbi:hypothetical protein ACHQM5_009291 [Ranunculus cassubicifolius]